MSEVSNKKKSRQISNITERFCSRLGQNTVIVTTKTANGEVKKCLYAEECEYKKDCSGKMI